MLHEETFMLKVVESTSLTDDLISQWRDLDSSAFEHNIYLSPDFILPSLQYLSADTNPVFIFIFYHSNSYSKMVFATVLEEIKPSLKCPFKLLSSYRTSHSFLSGFLIDADLHEKTLDTFFRYWSTQKRWHALDFWWHWSNTRQGQAIYDSAIRCNLKWIPVKQQNRAAIFSSPDINPIEKISKNLIKNVTKKRKQLSLLGDIEYRYINTIECMPAAIQSFLELEHQGWKGKNGSSLLTKPNHTQFFSSMTLALAKRNKVIFTEIVLSGKVIASTINYISGDAFFAFKTSRDESLDQYSLGILNELALVEQIPERLANFHIFDSGSETGSYMDNIWKDKILLTTGYFTNSALFRGYLFARHLTNPFK